jgi:hypothetical protein
LGGQEVSWVQQQFDRTRVIVTRSLLIVDVAAMLLDVFQVHGTLRFVVSLVFGLTVPGWSIVGFIHIRDVAWLVALCVATSLALETVLGEIILSWWWHLQIFEVILTLICASLLVRQLRRANASLEEVRR